MKARSTSSAYKSSVCEDTGRCAGENVRGNVASPARLADPQNRAASGGPGSQGGDNKTTERGTRSKPPEVAR
jgi:hypothetical protein